MKPRVVIHVTDGLIETCTTNIQDLEIQIVDDDTETMFSENVIEWANGEQEAYFYKPQVEYDPEATEEWDRISKLPTGRTN